MSFEIEFWSLIQLISFPTKNDYFFSSLSIAVTSMPLPVRLATSSLLSTKFSWNLICSLDPDQRKRGKWTSHYPPCILLSAPTVRLKRNKGIIIQEWESDSSGRRRTTVCWWGTAQRRCCSSSCIDLITDTRTKREEGATVFEVLESKGGDTVALVCDLSTLWKGAV